MNGTKRASAAAVLAGVAVTLAACGGQHSGQVIDAKTAIASCQGPVNSYIPIDATASGRDSGELSGSRKQALLAEMSRVAACGGRAKVVVFSSSSAATSTLFEDRLTLTGATDQAKARRLDQVAATATDRIAADYPAAVSTLTGGGSDPVAQMRLAAEWAQQIGGGRLRLFEITDGFQTAGVDFEQMMSNPLAAAARFTTPSLAGTDVVFAGIGETSGQVPPTAVVDALKTFYQELCARSGADSCTVVTQAAGGAR